MESRLPKLFLLICKENTYPTIQELATLFSVSTRTIYNDIKKLDEILTSNELPCIQVEKGVIAYQETVKQPFEVLLLLKEDFILDNPHLRRLRLLNEIFQFKGYFNIDHLIAKIPVSRNTLLHDLKWAKDELAFHHIELVSTPFIGYQLIGDERKIRQLFSSTILEDPMFFEQNHQAEQELRRCEAIIENLSKTLDVTLSDNSFDNLLIVFWTSLIRIRSNQLIDHDPIQSELTKEQDVFLTCQSRIADSWGSMIPRNELLLLAQRFSEASVIAHKHEVIEKWVSFNIIVDKFIRQMAKAGAYDFFLEDSLLYEGILNHLRPAYHRIKEGNILKNPMLEHIRANFAELDQQVLTSLSRLEEHLHLSFDENEASYFTLFFIASIERNRKNLHRNKKIIIVCEAGISTSEILKTKLEKQFDVVICGTFGKRRAHKFLATHNVDLIVSTIDFNYEKTPVIKVTPFLAKTDMEQLSIAIYAKKEAIELQEILQIISGEVPLTEKQAEKIEEKLRFYLGLPVQEKKRRGDYQPMLIEVLNESLIKTKLDLKTREEAVIASGELLVKNKLAKASYVEGMLENVEKNGTYIVIAPGIAMPHARPETGALDIGLSIVTLKEPVVFGHPTNDPVKIVVGLCAVDHQAHLRALAELVEILGNKEKMAMILEADSEQEVMEVIRGGN